MGLFDRNANDAFCDLYSKMAQRGFSMKQQEPHLTFGIYDHLDQKGLLDWVAEIARTQKKINVNFNHIGLFRQGICFAEPCANRELLELHQKIHSKYDQNCTDMNCLYSLKAKSWVPHVTLATMEPDQMGLFLPSVLALFQPIQATVMELEITEYAPLKSIQKYSLSE